MKKVSSKKQTQTPFEQALAQAKAGTLQTPSVNYQGKNLDYFGYQLATNKMALGLLTKGILMSRNAPKLKHYKEYYGLKGKTAKECLEQFLVIFENYTNSLKK